MDKIVITAGKKYIDIDAYAGIFAYKTLLNSLGYDAYAVTTANLNDSVSSIINDLGFLFDELPGGNLKYIVLDLSNPDFIDSFVKEEDIIEIIDHHTGYEDYWNEKNVKSQIEFIGSICTIIYERYIENKKENLLTEELCKLLVAGILDNTLNLKSEITTKRDIDAYNNLLKIGNIDNNWRENYFNSCYIKIKDNLAEAIKSDMKSEKVNSLLPVAFGQLIVPNIDVIFNNIEEVNKVFAEYPEWLFNVISLKEGRSYLLCSDDNVLNNMSLLFNGERKDNYIVLFKCMLRKQIMKKAREYDNLNNKDSFK